MEKRADVLALVITRAQSPERLELLQKTLAGALRAPGCALDVIVFANAAAAVSCFEHEAVMFAKPADIADAFDKVENVGQHVPFNWALAVAQQYGYRYLLRLDDDVEFLTHKWLKKLVDCAQAFDDRLILSPMIRGLKNLPSMSERVHARGFDLYFLNEAMGGICRLHPVALLTEGPRPYVSDARLTMGYGDATGIVAWALENSYDCAYLRYVRVKHAKGTLGQEAEAPEYFIEHDVLQHVPFFPPYQGAA